ncbi:MAG: hypothetical protein MHMPM18_002438 [Marteilia pararefringens]
MYRPDIDDNVTRSVTILIDLRPCILSSTLLYLNLKSSATTTTTTTGGSGGSSSRGKCQFICTHSMTTMISPRGFSLHWRKHQQWQRQLPIMMLLFLLVVLFSRICGKEEEGGGGGDNDEQLESNNKEEEGGGGGEEETLPHSDSIDDNPQNDNEEIEPQETQEERIASIMEGVEIGDIKIIQDISKDSFACKHIVYMESEFINHYIILLLHEKSPQLISTQVPLSKETPGININCNDLINIYDDDTNVNISDFINVHPKEFTSYILSIGDVFEFNDNLNLGLYNKSMSILHRINTTDFKWNLIKFESHSIDYIAFTFQGFSDSNFKENGSLELHIQIRKTIGEQSEMPKLPVNKASVIIEILLNNFRSDSPNSRLLTSMNFLVAQPIRPDRKLKYNIIDKIPAVFSNLTMKFNFIDKTNPTNYVALQMRPICYTSPDRQFFSLVDMHVYNQDEVSNLENVMLSNYFTNRMVQYLDDNGYRMRQVFVSCGQPSDNGYSFTNYNVFSFTISLNDQVHEHFDYSGVTFYFISLFVITIVVILSSWVSFRRKQANLDGNIQQNYSPENAAAAAAAPHGDVFAQLLNKNDENAGEDPNLKNDIGNRFENPNIN